MIERGSCVPGLGPGVREEVGVEAAQLVNVGRFDAVEAPLPDPALGEVVVEMRHASICGSDLHLVFGRSSAGPYPMRPGRPGHEGVGVVVDSRSARWSVGDQVLTVPMPGQGTCYAEYQAVGEDFLVALPNGIPLDHLVMAQQLGTVVFGFRRYWPVGLSATDRSVAVLGAGSAGLFALQLARLAGFAQVIVADLEPSRLEVAMRLGADRVVLAGQESFVDAVHDETGGAGADLVIEAAGFDACRADCIEAVRRNGRVGFFGLAEHPGLVPFPFELAFRKACSMELAGNAQLEPGLTSFAVALKLIAEGQIVLDDLLDARYRLSELQEAMEVAHDRRAVKVLIDF